MIANDEQILLNRLQQGDEKALEELYKCLRVNIFSLAFQMLKSKEEAEEVLQDTFLKLFKKADGYKPRRGSVRAYIYTIARNECISRLRAKQVRPQVENSWQAETIEGIAHEENKADPIDQIVITKALDNLKEEERDLVKQAFFCGYSHRELANSMGLPLGTVKNSYTSGFIAHEKLFGACMKNIKDLIPDYVLGLLEQEQEAQVEAFLDNCESCQTELQKYNTMFVGMVESLPKVSPSSDSWGKLKQQIHESVVESQTSSEVQRTQVSEHKGSLPSTNLIKRFGDIFKIPNLAYQSSLAILSVLTLGAFWWGGYQYKANADMVSEKQIVTSWLANAEAQAIPIRSTDKQQIGSLFLGPDQRALFVLAKPPPPGQAYQTWGELDGTCVSLGISQNSIFEVSWKDAYESLLVSLEPQDGSEQLTNHLAKVFMF